MLGTIREKRLLWPALATLLGMAFLISLGNWQMQRLSWKRGLIGSIAERVHAPPVTLALAEERASLGGDVEYTRVKVEGSELNDREIHLYALDDQYGPGFHVITPLRLADGSIVLVNRGFVPNELKDPAKRAAGQIAGDVSATGLLRVADVQTMFVPANDAQRNIWYWRDIGAHGRDARRRRAARAPIHHRRRGESASPRGLAEGWRHPSGAAQPASGIRPDMVRVGSDAVCRFCRICDTRWRQPAPTTDAAVGYWG